MAENASSDGGSGKCPFCQAEIPLAVSAKGCCALCLASGDYQKR